MAPPTHGRQRRWRAQLQLHGRWHMALGIVAVAALLMVRTAMAGLAAGLDTGAPSPTTSLPVVGPTPHLAAPTSELPSTESVASVPSTSAATPTTVTAAQPATLAPTTTAPTSPVLPTPRPNTTVATPNCSQCTCSATPPRPPPSPARQVTMSWSLLFIMLFLSTCSARAERTTTARH